MLPKCLEDPSSFKALTYHPLKGLKIHAAPNAIAIITTATTPDYDTIISHGTDW
jgi:hypothetical protein